MPGNSVLPNKFCANFGSKVLGHLLYGVSLLEKNIILGVFKGITYNNISVLN